MNARLKSTARGRAGLFVVSREVVGQNLQAGRWPWLRKSLQRMLLLLRSPIASFNWARAKRKALAPKEESAWQGRRSHSFADYERDGIIMGF